MHVSFVRVLRGRFWLLSQVHDHRFLLVVLVLHWFIWSSDFFIIIFWNVLWHTVYLGIRSRVRRFIQHLISVSIFEIQRLLPLSTHLLLQVRWLVLVLLIRHLLCLTFVRLTLFLIQLLINWVLNAAKILQFVHLLMLNILFLNWFLCGSWEFSNLRPSYLDRLWIDLQTIATTVNCRLSLHKFWGTWPVPCLDCLLCVFRLKLNNWFTRSLSVLRDTRRLNWLSHNLRLIHCISTLLFNRHSLCLISLLSPNILLYFPWTILEAFLSAEVFRLLSCFLKFLEWFLLS